MQQQPFVSTDKRLMTKRPFSSPSLRFASGIRNYNTPRARDVVAIDEDDMLFFYLAMLHFFPEWHQYESYTPVSKNDWRKIFAQWALLSGLDDFDAFIETACGLDYTNNTVSDKKSLYIVNNNARILWKTRRRERRLLENFRRWCDMQLQKGYKYITVLGF